MHAVHSAEITMHCAVHEKSLMRLNCELARTLHPSRTLGGVPPQSLQPPEQGVFCYCSFEGAGSLFPVPQPSPPCRLINCLCTPISSCDLLSEALLQKTQQPMEGPFRKTPILIITDAFAATSSFAADVDVAALHPNSGCFCDCTLSLSLCLAMCVSVL